MGKLLTFLALTALTKNFDKNVILDRSLKLLKVVTTEIFFSRIDLEDSQLVFEGFLFCTFLSTEVTTVQDINSLSRDFMEYPSLGNS